MNIAPTVQSVKHRRILMSRPMYSEHLDPRKHGHISVMMVMTIWLVVGLSSLSGACAADNKYRDPFARKTYKQFNSDTCKAIADAIWQGDTLRVAQLLSSQPKLATLVCGEWRRTPLHLAVLCKEAVIVRLLVNAGANIHQPDRSGTLCIVQRLLRTTARFCSI